MTPLTSKCASCHKGVHFFNISTSKSLPRPMCFDTFHFQICFVPQRHALFQQLNFQTTSKFASCHNGVQFFISHLAKYLHTRRVSEPNFRPSRAKNQWNNTVFCNFLTFLRTCIFFLLTFSIFYFLSSDFLHRPNFFLALLIPGCALHLSILSELWFPNFLRLVLVPVCTAQGGSYRRLVAVNDGSQSE